MTLRSAHGPTPALRGRLPLVVVALVLPALLGLVRPPASAAATCPCSIWSTSATPGNPSATGDTSAVELGVKFRSDVSGTVTGVRFFKGSANTGTHVGSLWTATGQKLASVTFTNETSSGWQQANFASPVSISADTTYIASYHAPAGGYAYDYGYFSTAGVDNAPLHALKDGVDGGNGVYKYGTSSFPTNTYNSTNYWVDVVFTTGADTIPPNVSSKSPADGASGVTVGTDVTATFDEDVQASTISFTLKDGAGIDVSAAVGYDAVTRTATLDPDADLAASTTHTATVSGAKDLAGNTMLTPVSWSFTTGEPAAPPPGEGPGGPILVVTTTANPYSRYYSEILRNEGLNAFYSADLSTITSTLLAGYDVVILGEAALTSAQVTMFTDWVNTGGNLIAMRPDKKLAGLLGLTDAAATLADAYLLVDTASAPGAGIVNETIQFHGVADRYSTSGARTVATLYSTATTATANPAATLRAVGTNGGGAASFTYDLARSVIFTRFGNQAWAGQNRDANGPVRVNDMFYGAASFDPQRDWIDFTKVAIPQADEQQRLLVNLIENMNEDRKPLPRFWYLPRGKKAAVVMTGDDHLNGGTPSRFDTYKNQSPPGCSVAAWECIRASSYIYTGTITPEAAAHYHADGFEVGLHVNTGCADYTSQAHLDSFYTDQLAKWKAEYSSLPAPTSERTHCVAWSDWGSQPKVQVKHGFRLDTNAYYYPPSWVADRPGFFTGAGMPMRFADLDGTMTDVYQATTQMTDESGQSYPFTIDTLLDRALGPNGYYGVFTANMHTDFSESAQSDAIVNSAKARGVPVVSGRQMAEWLDGRNASSFGSLTWAGNALSFTVSVGAGANGIQALLPATARTGPLTSLTLDGSPVTYTTETIKGVAYAVFAAGAGTYKATYGNDSDVIAPTLTSRSPAPGATGVAPSANVTATFDEDVQASTISFTLKDASGAAVAAGVTYDAATRTATLDPSADLASSTTYTATMSGAKDLAGNVMETVSWSFATADVIAPTLTSRSPAPGATGVAPSANATATFSEDVQASSISFTLKDAAGAAVAAGVTYDATTRTATLDPSADLASSTTYTATMSGAKDLAGNVMATVSWSFTTAAVVACPCSIWPSSDPPGVAVSTDSTDTEVGVKFRSEVPGYVTGIRFYKASANSGTHVGTLWTAAGAKLASATFTNETASGWQQVNFSVPVAIAANTTYVASYYAPVGRYSYTTSYFTRAVDSPPLRALADGTDGKNGVYRSGKSGFPNRSVNATNYWVDVVFVT